MFTISNRNLNNIILQNAKKIEIQDIITPGYFYSYERKRNVSISILKKENKEKIILAKNMLKQIIKGKDKNKQFSINTNINLISILNLLRR